MAAPLKIVKDMVNSSNYNDAVNRAIFVPGLTVDHFTKVKADLLLQEARKFFFDLSEIRALDVGCGIGNFHPYFKDKFKSLAAVDISAAALEQARRGHEWVEYKLYDGCMLPYPDNCFRLVFTINVMHHVSPGLRPQLLAQAARVLRQDGMFIVFQQNPFNILTRRVVSNCEFDKGVHLIRRKAMKNLLEEAGLRIIKSPTILTIPHLFPVMRGLDLILGRLPFGTQYFMSAVPSAESASGKTI